MKTLTNILKWAKNNKAISISFVIGLLLTGVIFYARLTEDKRGGSAKYSLIERESPSKSPQDEEQDKNTESTGGGITDSKVYAALVNTGSPCHLNHTSENCRRIILGTYASGATREFSDQFVTIMNLAGDRFTVPPSVLLAYMAGINSLGHYSYYWTKEAGKELERSSLPWYGTMWGCDELDYLEQGPYDWILVWFTGIKETYGADVALNELSEGRGDSASRCNFLDATFVAASYFGHESSCSDGWGSYIEKMRSLSFGVNREGAYEEDARYEGGGLPQQIFEACRN